jgi:hypothetical protein
MTLDELFRRTGPCTRITQAGVVRYDLPSGGLIEVFPERAFDNSSGIKAIQLYRIGEKEWRGDTAAGVRPSEVHDA